MIQNKCNTFFEQCHSEESLNRAVARDTKSKSVEILYSGTMENCPYYCKKQTYDYVLVTIDRKLYKQGQIGNDGFWRYKEYKTV